MRKNYINAFVVGALAVSLGSATACQPKAQSPDGARVGGDRKVAKSDAKADAGGDAKKGDAKQGSSDRFKITYDEKADLVGGAKEPLVTIVEYTDIQCPYCSRLANSMHELEKKYPNDVRVVVKHFPLPMHKDAHLASQGILAAHAQGKGWEMHDKMFKNQRALKREQLDAYAAELGLDAAAFGADLDSGKYKAQVDADMKSGKNFAVRSTPSFFMNGKPFKGALPMERLSAEVDKEIAAAKKLMADKGVKRGDVYAHYMKNAATKREPEQRKQQQRPGKPDATKNYAVPTDGRPQAGKDDALVTIVEFSDFQCPFCSRVNPTLKKIKETYPNDVRVVFRQQPLPMHKQAPDAAKAALAAHKQGKFWQMHDALFAANKQLAQPGKFAELAGQVGLDVAKFEADMKSPEIAKMVAEDQKIARQFGANGTPAFFVNGRFVSGAQPFEKFEALIKEEKAKAEKFMAAKGVGAAQVYDAMRKGWEKEVKAAAPKPPADNKRRQVSTDGLPGKGNLSSPKITIVECSDFDCPFCNRATGIMDQVMKEYGDKVAFYFRHYPLPMHKNAEPAHRAAIAAEKQGKFWEMHDLLFKDKSKRSEADFVAYAEQLGMDTAKFKADWAAPATAQRVKDDIAACQKLEVRGAPGFLINGRLMSGAQPFPRFKSVLDEELKGGPKKAG
jgi:protein-disulfide isomerase